MAASGINGIDLLGTGLQELLMADSIVPGVQASYQLCKTIYASHPHGAKIADKPVAMAMFKARKITVPRAPDDGAMLVEAFERQWKDDQVNRLIFNTSRLARVYGVSTLGIVIDGDDSKEPLEFKGLAKARLSFNVWDPLNTAGSLVLNQDPNALDFQKAAGVSVNGKSYHRSRVCVLQNEDPLYIEYEPSGFGFLGRSVYQRGLVPLKSFVLTLATDMMIALKAGVLVTKMQSQSSAVDGVMAYLLGQKRAFVKEAQTGNVLTIGVDEDIESLNLQNLDGAYGMARKNIIDNEAAACGTPAKLLLEETFAEGFGEGTEDAKALAQYIDGVRTWMGPLYEFMDGIVMYRAWNEDFYETVQARYPEEYGNVPYAVAFQDWKNSFTAEWPNLLEEPDSEKLKGEDVVLKAIIAVFEVLAPELPPDQRAELIEWVTENLNEKKLLFPSPLTLDIDAIRDYEPPVQAALQEPGAPKPESSTDAAPRRRTQERFDAADADLRRTAKAALHVLRGQAVGE